MKLDTHSKDNDCIIWQVVEQSYSDEIHVQRDKAE